MKEAGVEIGVRERNNRRQNSKEMSNEDYSPETKHSKEDDKHCYTNASTDEQDGILLSHSIFRFLFNRINYTKQKRNNTELKQKPDIKMESSGIHHGILIQACYNGFNTESSLDKCGNNTEPSQNH